MIFPVSAVNTVVKWKLEHRCKKTEGIAMVR